MVAAFLSFMAQIILSKIEIAEFESEKISGCDILVVNGAVVLWSFCSRSVVTS